MRIAVDVRGAAHRELAALAVLCAEARGESSAGVQVCTPDTDRIVRHLSVLLAVPGGVVLGAYDGDEPVGFLLARVVSPGALNDEPSLYIEAVYVSSAARRRGVGHALLAMAAEIAVSTGCVDVYAVPIPGARGIQRFFARMGFAPAVAHRVVTTATLQRRLAAEAGPNKRAVARQGIEDLIARRRRARAELTSGPVDLREFQRARREDSDRVAR
ncbi:GNAT family N-acetyltransferase [Paraoerskovia marina]|uniref:GNAT family N-acetyltransferase n=1 Tax=Paraoerskovia marina TaxID=545619 RepID=UPI000694C292|nr:GNAT family N-acetyltransferase [Paraoerskovia marina]